LSSTLTLLVLVSAGASADPSTTALLRAARQALGADSNVVLQEFDRTPTDDELSARASAAHAGAVAEVLWLDADRRRASIHAHVDPQNRWIDRQIGFEKSDAPTERGRALGFAIASMLPEEWHAEPPTVTVVTSPPPPAAPPREAAEVPPSAPPPPRRWAGVIEASAIGATGFTGYAGGVGGALGGRWMFASRFGLRLAGGARVGDVSPAQATSLVVYGALGFVALPVHTTSFDLGLRLDVLGLRQSITRPNDANGVSTTEARYLPGGDLMLEGVWFFSEGVGFALALGSEVASGETDIVVRNQTAATVPAPRLAGEGGIRARF
jgi:hypothetical protein